MRVVYFAWLREHIGASSEEIALPEGVKTVGDLAFYLRGLSDGHARALSNLEVVRVAVNKVYGGLESEVSDSDEVAFFPPVTGG